MGLFDQLFTEAQENLRFTPQNEQEAWIAVMYGCIAVDDHVADAELDALCNTVIFKTMFNSHKIAEYYTNAMAIHQKIGSKALIDSSAQQVNPENRPTLFALTLELLLADGVLEDKEQEIINYLSEALQLEPEMALKIVEVILIKNKGNTVVL